MYKKILVPIDDSNTSNLALQEAMRLAKVHQSTIRLIHVVDEFFLTTGEIAIDYVAYENAIRETGQKLLAKMKKTVEATNIPVETFLIEITDYSPRIPEKIIEDATTQNSDLIVIGTHGRRGFSHLMLGSVAEGVIRMATIPVLLIRSPKGVK